MWLMSHGVRIAASILASDFGHLAEEIRCVESAGAEYIHLDVMDGHFVPNITIGPPVIRALRHITDLPFDVHLMISDPGKHLPAFADAGANILTVHVEATPHLHRVLQQTLALGVRPGVSLNPATPTSLISEVLNDVDSVLVMSVNPGFGGQKFIDRSLVRIAELRRMLDDAGSDAELKVDGGININTAERVVAAGATVLVAGTAIFDREEGIAAAISGLRHAGSKGSLRRASAIGEGTTKK